jgi:aspartate dehydrogenase
MLKLGLIGYGAIGTLLEGVLRQHAAKVHVVAILRREHGPGCSTAGIPFIDDVDGFIAAGCGTVIECAGHGAAREHVPSLLGHGIDVVLGSIGVLADDAFARVLDTASQTGGGRLMVPAGAVAGLDGLRAARLAGLESVTYRGRKPPAAWRGTHAEKLLDLDALAEPQVFFEGVAREACLQYPKNANVTASISLAGLGFDRTVVTLEAVPGLVHNEHYIEAKGVFGEMSFTLRGVPSPGKPGTSLLAAYSLASAALEN